MASYQATLQQQNKHPRAASKLHAPPSQERSSDPWSFLELIDAPQWVDLSLEASLAGKEGYDSWFDRSHKHHAMSLAGLNTNMFWLRLGKSSQGKGPMLSKECMKEVNKPAKKQSTVHLNKLGNERSQSKSRVTGLRVQKGAQHSNNIERGCNARRLCDSVGCSLSGQSSTSECEPSGSFKKHSFCSDRSSVSSSSLQACSVELKLSSNGQRGSSNVNQLEDFHDTPTSGNGGAQMSRISSSASYHPMAKSRYSSEVAVSTCTKSSELFVSSVIKSQFVCEADRQSSGDSVVTSVSRASRTSEEEQVGKGCARTSEEVTDCLRKISEREDDVDYNQLLLRSLIAHSSTLNENLLHGQHSAKEVVKSSIKARRQRLEMRISQVGSLPSKPLHTGKENAPPNESSTVAKFWQVKDKPFHSKAPLALATSKKANARTVSLGIGGGFHASQNRGHASSIAHERKRSEVKQLPGACSLSALVAEHNRKIQSLAGLQSVRKGLR